jgi:hypothetical protein
MSRVVAEQHAGVVVPAGDARALAEAIVNLAGDDALRARAAEAARQWAADRTWSRVAAPLLDFAANPRRDPYRPEDDDALPRTPMVEEPLLRRIQRAIRRGGR